MKKYSAMFYWENNSNLQSLINYRKTFHEYIQSYENNESIKLKELRTDLIISSPKVESALFSVNILPWMDYGSQASGYRRMSITHEIPEFVKCQYDLLGHDDETLQKIDDVYLRAIGIYQNNKIQSLLNVINPFLYINIFVKVLLLPIFTIFDIKPIKQESGMWLILQFVLRIPAYYITVIHPIIVLMGYSEFEQDTLKKIVGIIL